MTESPIEQILGVKTRWHWQFLIGKLAKIYAHAADFHFNLKPINKLAHTYKKKQKELRVQQKCSTNCQMMLQSAMSQ